MSNVIDYAPVPSANPTRRWMKWTGRVLSALPVIMLGGGGIYALFNPAMMKDGMSKQGWPVELATSIAILEVVCAVIYAIPQTAVLGAILLTGYLGGAVASHVRAGEAVMAAPAIIFGVITWLGLFFRDARVRSLAPWRRLPDDAPRSRS